MMTSWTTWTPLVAAIVALGVTSGAVAVALALPLAGRSLGQLAPATRFRTLMTLLAAPILAAAIFLAIAFVPSVLDALGLVSDHCAYHVDHAFHLCFIHGVPPDAVWPLVLLIPLVLAALWALLTEAKGLRRARRWARQLRTVGRYDEELGCWLLDADGVTLTIGTLQPEIFASASLAAGLGDGQWKAVLAHEHAHRRRRDGLVKSIARLMASLHLPCSRRRLLHQLDVASEQACDESAAAVVGDPTEVASAIVTIARLQRPNIPTRFALAFGAHPIEQRVRGLLDQRWVRFPRFAGSLTAAGLVAAFIVAYEPLHHAFETALTYFF